MRRDSTCPPAMSPPDVGESDEVVEIIDDADASQEVTDADALQAERGRLISEAFLLDIDPDVYMEMCETERVGRMWVFNNIILPANRDEVPPQRVVSAVELRPRTPEELLARAYYYRRKAASMGNTIKMSLADREARSHLLANADYLEWQAKRLRMRRAS